MQITVYQRTLYLGVLLVWSILFFSLEDSWAVFTRYGHFFLVGLLGATIANATGVGGGIIFIPFFTMLGISSTETLGTSFLIQCFGMTAGSISWLCYSHIAKSNSFHLNNLIKNLLFICGVGSILGVLCGQYLIVPEHPELMIFVFRAFSIIFGIILLSIIYYNHKLVHTQFDLSAIDKPFFFIVCLIGGMITAWISVGVGEIIAIALILRRYPTMVAIAIGVVMSSISVTTGAYQHVVMLDSVDWSLVLFAVPGAIIGGSLAYLLSELLGPLRLKVFFAIWIILTGIFI